MQNFQDFLPQCYEVQKKSLVKNINLTWSECCNWLWTRTTFSEEWNCHSSSSSARKLICGHYSEEESGAVDLHFLPFHVR